jgi:PadR family transcriptional regulator PadR
MYMVMAGSIENWKTQIRKGYLELCILLVIRSRTKVYGFDLIDQLAKASIDLKEGTLYPLLNRMSADGLLAATWDTENVKGHPRKFYALTKDGLKHLEQMAKEFSDLITIYQSLNK